MINSYCILLRYNSLYSNFAEELISASGMNDFIFTNTVSFIASPKKNNTSKKVRPIKNIGLLLTGNDNQLKKFEEKFNEMINANIELKDKIRYFIAPVDKVG